MGPCLPPRSPRALWRRVRTAEGVGKGLGPLRVAAGSTRVSAVARWAWGQASFSDSWGSAPLLPPLPPSGLWSGTATLGVWWSEPLHGQRSVLGQGQEPGRRARGGPGRRPASHLHLALWSAPSRPAVWDQWRAVGSAESASTLLFLRYLPPFSFFLSDFPPPFLPFHH